MVSQALAPKADGLTLLVVIMHLHGSRLINIRNSRIFF